MPIDVAELSDRTEINEALNRYTIAIDTGEFDRLDTVFTPDAQVDYTESGGIAAGFAEVKPWLAENLPAFSKKRMHTLGQVAISFANTRDLARHAERWGYHRYWLAEHHNIPGIASAATSVVIAHVAEATSTIRVVSGGIMLPNHAPLVIAETRVDVPEASVGDAVMMLDLRHTNAMLFKNSGTGYYNMVYRRGDGTIGWVEPARA